MSQLFEIGRSALRSYQTALNVVGQNLANSETPGYARQRVSLTTRDQLNGAGSGVNVSSIERLADQYAQLALRDAVAERAGAEVRSLALGRLDATLSDPATGLAEPLRDILSAASALTANPTDIPTRQQFLAAADAFASRVGSLQGAINAESVAAREELRLQLGGINEDLNELARIEQTLSRDAVNTDTSNSNLALQDRRDQILDDLAGNFGLNATISGDGKLRLSLPNGQAVLSDGRVSPIALGNDEYGAPQLTVAGLAVRNDAFGGRIGGLLELSESDLPAALDRLGQIAAGLASTINAVQQQGVDLDGVAGLALFNLPSPNVLAAAGNTGAAVLNASIDDAGNLTANRFELRFDGLAWSATLPDGQNLSLTGTGTVVDPLLVDGLSINLTGVALAGDRFLVQPAALNGFSTTGLDARQLATAPAASPAASQDNDNARELFDRLSAGVFDGGQTSLQDANINWVAGVGSAARSADNRVQSAAALEQGAIIRREQAQGVSLDEEAADLLRFEQAYAAAAQVLATADSLFDTLLNAVRR